MRDGLTWGVACDQGSGASLRRVFKRKSEICPGANPFFVSMLLPSLRFPPPPPPVFLHLHHRFSPCVATRASPRISQR